MGSSMESGVIRDGPRGAGGADREVNEAGE
jgi:hypothetical protein